VYNPLGPKLPPAQEELELTYKNELRENFSIEFNSLFTITNMPIKRFLRQLEREGQVEEYQNLLLENVNLDAAKGVMCRDLISVGWDGQLYDCDFNQMLDMPAANQPKNLWDFSDLDEIESWPIATGSHCYGCTAGAGSSCGGTLT